MNPKTVFFYPSKIMSFFLSPRNKYKFPTKVASSPQILYSCSSSQIHLWSKSQISLLRRSRDSTARASRTSRPQVSNRLTPTFLLSHRDLMVPRAQNCQSQSLRPKLSDSDRNILLLKNYRHLNQAQN